MAKLLASSQITIVDLNDAVSLRSYIGCSHARVQFLNNNGTYVPNFQDDNNNVTLKAELNKLGNSTNLVQTPGNLVTRVEWFVKLAPSKDYVKITPQMTDYELISNGVANIYTGLKIKKNIMNKSHPGVTFKVEMDYKEAWMEDTHVQISEIDFNLTIQGEDGSDAYTAVLTNSTHSIICNPNGSADDGEIGINGRAFSDALAFKGTSVLTAVANNPTTGQFSISLEGSGCTAVKQDPDTFYIDTIEATSALINADGNLKSANIDARNTSNGGKVKVTFNLEGVTTIVQYMTFSKVYNGADGINGIDGADGESAKYITLSIKEGTAVFKYDKNSSTPNVSTTKIEAIKFNINNPSYVWSYLNNGTWTNISGQTSSILTVNATDSYFNSSNSVTFRCTVNNLYSDEITISKLIDGNDSVLVQLSNESHVIACYNGGGFKPGEADRATTEVVAYKGATALSLTTGTPGKGQYKIEVISNSAITHSLSGNIIKITNMTADSAVLVINVNCEGTIYKKTMSLSKAKDGREGIDSYVAALTNEFHSLPARTDGTVTSYNGCSTSIELYKGSELITTGVTYSALANSGVTGSLSGNTYTVTDLSVDSSSVQLTAQYNGRSYSKIFTLTKNKQGTSGADSTSYWLIPSSTSINKDKNGVLNPTSITYTSKKQTGNAALTDFAGRFKIYTSNNKGQTYTLAYTSGSNESSKTYNLPSDLTAIKCELYLTDGTTLVDTQTIIVTSDGADGSDGRDAAYVIVSGENTFKYAPNFIGTPTPSSIVLTRSLFNVTGGKWQYFDDTSWVDFNPVQTGATLEITPTMAHFATSSNKVMRVRYFINSSVYDETSIVKVADGAAGANAFTVILDNETHTVVADQNGNLLSGEAAKATTNVIVYKGADKVTNFKLTKVSETGISTTVNDSNKTITLSSMVNNSNSGTCTVKITVEGQDIQKIFSVTKTKQGANGAPAKLITITPSANAFVTNKDGAVTPNGNITLTATTQGLSGNVTWQKSVNGGAYGSIGSGAETVNGNTLTISKNNIAAGSTVSYKAYITSGSTYEDIITIPHIREGNDGTNAYTVILSNPSHTVPANSNGDVTQANLNTCTTDIIVYKGSSTVKPTVNNLSAVPSNLFRIEQATDTANAKIIMSSFPNNVDTATATVDVVVGGQTIKQTFTVTKAKQGAQGNPAKAVFVSGPQIFKYAKNGASVSPTTITLSAVEKNFTGTRRKWYANNNEIAGQTGTNLVINPSSTTSGQYFMNSDSVTFKYESDGLTDEITVTKMYDGTDTYSVILTNESHSISCNKDGVPLDGELAKALTSVKVFRGTTELTASNTAAANKFVISKGTLTGCTANYVVTNSVNTGVVIASMTADTGTVPISINIDNGKANVTKTFSVAKVKVGATGAAGAPAKVIQITGASTIIQKKDGSYDPSNGIALTVVKKNTSDSIKWYNSQNQEIGTGDSYTVPTNVFSNTKTYTIKAQCSGDSSVYDTHTISKVTDGVDSITSYIWAPNGTTIRNSNTTSLTVEGVIFSGSSNVSTTVDAKFKWQKKVGDKWVDIKTATGNQQGNTISVSQDDIPAMLIIKCAMTYKGTEQVDTIVLEDINDPVQSVVFSTAGTTFKNGIGETWLVAKAIRNGTEIDVIRLVDTLPSNSSGFQGEIIYVKNKDKYYKYNNNAWVELTEIPQANSNSLYSYNWTKYDSNGNIVSGWRRTGKVIHITAGDVTQKSIFMVDIEG